MSTSILMVTAVSTRPTAFALGIEDIPLRAGFAFGPWISKFKQSDSAHEARVTSVTSLGFDVSLGVRLTPLFFIDLTFDWFLPAYSAGPQARDANYFSPLGIVAGVTLPVIPIELSVGYEYSSYGLSGGTDPTFSGSALKVGAKFIPIKNGKATTGLLFQLKRVNLPKDDNGDLPGHISTQALVYFLGLAVAVN